MPIASFCVLMSIPKLKFMQVLPPENPIGATLRTYAEKLKACIKLCIFIVTCIVCIGWEVLPVGHKICCGSLVIIPVKGEIEKKGETL